MTFRYALSVGVDPLAQLGARQTSVEMGVVGGEVECQYLISCVSHRPQKAIYIHVSTAWLQLKQTRNSNAPASQACRSSIACHCAGFVKSLFGLSSETSISPAGAGFSAKSY